MGGQAEETLLTGRLCFAAYSTVHAFAAVYRPLLAPLGLTYPQYLVMLVLWERGETGVGDLCRLVRLDSGTVTPLLKRLEASGLVTRRRSDADERRVLVALSHEGRRLGERAAGIPAAILDALGGDLDEIRRLNEMLEAVRARLAAAADGQQPSVESSSTSPG